MDIPGHPRVRQKFEDYVDRARGIVFVVDSAEFLSQKTDVAEQLYEVLSHSSVMRRRTPLLLACNKSDLGARAHTVDYVRKRLEKEIEQLRTTRRTLSDNVGKRETDALGQQGNVFTFEGLAKVRGQHVTATSISAADGDIRPVISFIRKCIPR